MPKADDRVERALLAFVSRSPGYVVALLALLSYAAGLVVPLALRWSAASVVVSSLLGTGIAAVLSLGWLIAQLESRDRRHLVEWTTNLRLLNAQEFEWLVGELFRREGWRVREMGGHGKADGNVDLELTRGDQRSIVQCKRWVSWLVPVDEIRSFAGTLLREGLHGPSGIFVTLSDFTEQAEAEAQKVGIVLIDRRELYTRIERVRRAEPCPSCGSPMVLDRSPHGWWLRCVAAGCRGKRDLGTEPGRAIELLTQTL